MISSLIVYTLPADTDWDAMRALAKQRAQELYLDVPGLVSKAFVIDPERGMYGGNYLWESRQALDDFLQSAPYNNARARFGTPQMQIFEVAAFVEHGRFVG
jgi:hypothetical protein